MCGQSRCVGSARTTCSVLLRSCPAGTLDASRRPPLERVRPRGRPHVHDAGKYLRASQLDQSAFDGAACGSPAAFARYARLVRNRDGAAPHLVGSAVGFELVVVACQRCAHFGCGLVLAMSIQRAS